VAAPTIVQTIPAELLACTGNPLAPDAWSDITGGTPFPRIQTRSLNASGGRMFIKLPKPRYIQNSPTAAYSPVTNPTSSVHIVTTGVATGAAPITRATYTLYYFECPSINTATWTSFSNGNDTFEAVSSTVTDAHASNGSDWTSTLVTSVTANLTPAGIVDTLKARWFAYGSIVLSVTLPYDAVGASMRVNGIGLLNW